MSKPQTIHNLSRPFEELERRVNSAMDDGLRKRFVQTAIELARNAVEPELEDPGGQMAFRIERLGQLLSEWREEEDF